MIIRIYNWDDKKLTTICNNMEIVILIDEHMRIGNYVFDYNHYFVSEISHKLHNIDLLDLYVENRVIKGFNYQLKCGGQKK